MNGSPRLLIENFCRHSSGPREERGVRLSLEVCLGGEAGGPPTVVKVEVVGVSQVVVGTGIQLVLVVRDHLLDPLLVDLPGKGGQGTFRRRTRRNPAAASAAIVSTFWSRVGSSMGRMDAMCWVITLDSLRSFLV